MTWIKGDKLLDHPYDLTELDILKAVQEKKLSPQTSPDFDWIKRHGSPKDPELILPVFPTSELKEKYKRLINDQEVLKEVLDWSTWSDEKCFEAHKYDTGLTCVEKCLLPDFETYINETLPKEREKELQVIREYPSQIKKLKEELDNAWNLDFGPAQQEVSMKRLLDAWYPLDQVEAILEKYKCSREVVSAATEKPQCAFRKRDDFWEIIFEGNEVHLKDAQGLRYIAYLLQHPNKEFPVLKLIEEVEGTLPNENAEIYQKMDKEQLAGEGLSISDPGAGVEVIDDKAKADYSRRIIELKEEIDEAEKNNDPTRANMARSEKESLEEYLLAASGFRGRTRTFSIDAERARSSVTKCINVSRKKIREKHPELGQHLNKSIKTGFSCSYSPYKPTSWET